MERAPCAVALAIGVVTGRGRSRHLLPGLCLPIRVRGFAGIKRSETTAGAGYPVRGIVILAVVGAVGVGMMVWFASVVWVLPALRAGNAR